MSLRASASNKPLDAIAIGSCYVDTNPEDYPFGDTGIPAEVELVGGRYETVPGGSAVSFCLLLQALGLETAFIGMAGTDPNGDLLTSLLNQRGIEPMLIRQPNVLTNISFNMTNPQGKHIMLVAGTANASLSPETVIPKLKDVLPQVRTLYLGGCFKLKTFIHAFAEIANYARQNKVTLVVDHGRIPDRTSTETLKAIKELVTKADYYFPSRDEFFELWGVNNIEDGLRALTVQAPNLVTVVKSGGDGAYFLANDTIQHIEAMRVDKVINATGAGDSFNAGVIVALNHGHNLRDAIVYGCQIAAAKIASKPLPQPTRIIKT